MAHEGKVTSLKFPILPPHRLFAYLHQHIQSPAEHVDFYWRWAQSNYCPWAKLGGPGIIPAGLYGDEARYSEAGAPEQKVIGIFVNLVLFRPASIRHSRWLVFSIRSSLCIGSHTLYPVLRYLVWSFHLAWLGRTEDGQQLCADGSRFLVTELRGDLAWHRTIWQFKVHGWQSTLCCFWCQAKAKGDTHLFSEIGMTASWLSTIYTDTWEWVTDMLPSDSPLCL